MEYKLTVLCPGIRIHNWKRLVDSISKACSDSWELIFISPYELPEELKQYNNISIINDWGTPIRCQQLGLLQSKGEYVTWAADDGYFIESSLDIALNTLKGLDYKSLVMGKYVEGNNDGDYPMTEDKYYYLKTHESMQSLFFSEQYLMLNVGVVSRELLFEVGGWDCMFEVCPMSYNDLAIRLQNYNCKFIIQNELMFKCSHMPGHEGDHGPVHDAQTLNDERMFRTRYRRNMIDRVKIDINNWRLSPSRWERRFGRSG